MNRRNMKGLLWGVLAVLTLTVSSCDNKKGGAAEAADATDSTAVETEAVNESAYDLEAIAKVIDGCEDLESFRCGLAAVKKNGKIGYIDKMGNVVIPFEYDSPTQVFRDGVGTVFKGMMSSTWTRRVRSCSVPRVSAISMTGYAATGNRRLTASVASASSTRRARW